MLFGRNRKAENRSSAQSTHTVGPDAPMNEPLRQLGKTGIYSPRSHGLLADRGVTSIDGNEKDSIETIGPHSTPESTFFDTAHIYGYDGGKRAAVGSILGPKRDSSSSPPRGTHWKDKIQIKVDRGPARWECEESRRRWQTSYVDLLYLHAPRPRRRSASRRRTSPIDGTRQGPGGRLSNATVPQMKEFSGECPWRSSSLRYNMLPTRHRRMRSLGVWKTARAWRVIGLS